MSVSAPGCDQGTRARQGSLESACKHDYAGIHETGENKHRESLYILRTKYYTVVATCAGYTFLSRIQICLHPRTNRASCLERSKVCT